MGIYTNGVIYGFSIFIDDLIYKEVYEKPVDLENINHFRNAYNMLNEDQINKASFSFYCEFSSTYENSKPFISSYPVSKDRLVKYLTKSELTIPQ
jgi:hypothetical protein